MRFRNAHSEQTPVRRSVVFSACLLFLAVTMVACDSNSGDEESSISGTVTIPAGATGSVENTRVAIYTSRQDQANDTFLRTSPADANGNYSFEDLPPGIYYIDAWKDNNSDGFLSQTDFFGVFGTCNLTGCTLDPIEIQDGDQKSGNINMAVL